MPDVAVQGAPTRTPFLLALAALAFLGACRRDDPPPPRQDATAAPPPAASPTSPPASTEPPAPSASAKTGIEKPKLSAEEQKRRALFEAALGRGRKAAREGRYEAAIAAFDEAAKADPGDPRAPAERGHAKLLAGDLQGADVDLEDALLRSGDPDLLSQIWFNLGLAREKTPQLEEGARVAFANAHLLKPSAATKSKLAGRSTCTVEIQKQGLDDLQSADGYRGLFDLVGRPEEREDLGDEKPKTEERAREMLCAPDHFDERHCRDDAPFSLSREYMMYTWTVIWVFPRKEKNRFWVDVAGRAGGWPARCTGSTGIEATVEGGIARVRTHNDGTDAAFEGGEFNDEGRCKDGVGWTEETFFDLGSGKAIASVRWADRSQATIRVEGRTVVVSGGGCNERISL